MNFLNTTRLFVVSICILFGATTVFSQNAPDTQDKKETCITKEHAIEIAKKDAIIAYKNLESFEIVVSESKKKWYIQFQLEKGLDGGGPEYVISKKTGKILKKTYWQ